MPRAALAKRGLAAGAAFWGCRCLCACLSVFRRHGVCFAAMLFRCFAVSLLRCFAALLCCSKTTASALC